jgi:bla regulator protein BlaR1
MSFMQMSLSGGALILAAILIRALAIHRLPKNMLAALWGVACARLLLPFTWPSRLSLLGRLAREAPALNAGTGPSWTAVEGVQTGLNLRAANAAAPAFPIWTLIWAVGALGCALWFGMAFIRGRKRFKESLPASAPELEKWMETHRLRRTVRIRVSDRIAAPLTYGIFAPVILLPRNMKGMEERQLDYILEHEWTHIRRMDAVYKLVLALCCCVHWFNPLVWVMFVLANRDIELKTDERVVGALKPDERKAYLYTLIQMEERKGEFAPFCSHFSKNALEERIAAVMKMKSKSIFAMGLAVTVMLGAGAAFATSAPQMEAAAHHAQTAEVNGDARLNQWDYQQTYARYEPFGLSYNQSEGRLYYKGKKVRNFEDMYPIDEENSAGTVFSMPAGEVDVRAIRELNDPIERNPDGTFDPSGRLVGLEALSQQEFDQRTRKYAQEEAAYTKAAQGTSEASELADGGSLDPEIFQEYLSLGLEVSDGALYFQGKRVRDFNDTYTAGWRTISVQNYDEQGEIDVKAVREGEKLVELVGIEAVR